MSNVNNDLSEFQSYTGKDAGVEGKSVWQCPPVLAKRVVMMEIKSQQAGGDIASNIGEIQISVSPAGAQGPEQLAELDSGYLRSGRNSQREEAGGSPGSSFSRFQQDIEYQLFRVNSKN